jgi:hypothetical protein
VARGDIEAAERYAQETMVMTPRYHFPFGAALALPAIACAHMLHGAWAKAKDALDRLSAPGHVFDNPAPSFGPITQVYRQLVRVYAEIDESIPEAMVSSFPSALGKNGLMSLPWLLTVLWQNSQRLGGCPNERSLSMRSCRSW